MTELYRKDEFSRLFSEELDAVWKLRRELSQKAPADAMENLLKVMEKTKDNKEFVGLVNKKNTV